MRGKTGRRRNRIVVFVISLVFVMFLVNLFNIQIFQSENIEDAAVSSVDVSVDPLRGEIFDRNGNPLVVNKQVNTIVINYQVFPSGSQPEKRNKMLLELIKLFDSQNIEWNDKLPIVISNGKLKFEKDKEAEISYLKSSSFLNLEYYASVQNCFDALVERYELESYTLSQARDIASVYYSMRKNGFNESTPYVFAEDVSDEVVAVIKENSKLYVGADVQVKAVREYTDGTIAPHILGIVGSISPQEYEKKKDEGYSLNDVIGKSGIEYSLESELRGTAGLKRITVDSAGNVEETYIKEPVAGNNIILTIDKNIQKVAQDALADLIHSQHTTRKNVDSGAVVVMDTRTNEVLACASYPTFDLSQYNEKSTELNLDKAKPLWNRALRSTYTPGSTIKPAVAMAGLQEGIITDSYRVVCGGIYRYYKDYQPGCTGVHGSQNVVNALFNSCNIFFYETSRLLGIEKLNDYFTMFGLGQKTGVEIAENEGTVDSVSLRESKGEYWTPGLTIQAGIGHGDNQFTPIQLCSYVSTIANRGVRYRAHFIQSIKSHDFSKTLMQTENQVLSKANFSDKNWDLVHQGMLLVGTRSYADFSSVPVKIAAKTGTSTIEKTINGEKIDTYNGLILTFAPYENPRIAVAVVIEGAGSGGSTAPVAAAIMKYYFSSNKYQDTAQSEGSLY